MRRKRKEIKRSIKNFPDGGTLTVQFYDTGYIEAYEVFSDCRRRLLRKRANSYRTTLDSWFDDVQYFAQTRLLI